MKVTSLRGTRRIICIGKGSVMSFVYESICFCMNSQKVVFLREYGGRVSALVSGLSRRPNRELSRRQWLLRRVPNLG